MPTAKLDVVLAGELESLTANGTRKGAETVIAAVRPAGGGEGPRYLLTGEEARPFIRMNSNGYLGLAMTQELRRAEQEAVADFGTGPGAVRFISGTYQPHEDLEHRLADFHGREAAMIFSSAYATVMAILPSLTTPETVVVSDELNHNCIINAIRLARPRDRRVYPHLDLVALEEHLRASVGEAARAIVVTDGVFSMRGDVAPLDRILDLARTWDDAFDEGVLVVVDDSHGVGAFGATGRGSEEHTGAPPADLLIGTLGKAFGVNGGYVAAGATLIDYLRETAALYIYSNPITPAEAAAAIVALDMVDSDRGHALLSHLRDMTARLEAGLVALEYEIIEGPHPIVPLLVRDTGRARELVDRLYRHGVLATAITYPVVPRGEEEIRFQVSADHTPADIDAVLAALRG